MTSLTRTTGSKSRSARLRLSAPRSPEVKSPSSYTGTPPPHSGVTAAAELTKTVIRSRILSSSDLCKLGRPGRRKPGVDHWCEDLSP
jgi:hypothetical protein